MTDGQTTYEKDGRIVSKTIKITEPCHARINDLRREGERQSDVIQRALDALEREANLPAAVTVALKTEVSDDAPKDEHGDPVFEVEGDDE
jgi:Arc/MetJ-type ribon-helix-helix transcriptional regulator